MALPRRLQQALRPDGAIDLGRLVEMTVAPIPVRGNPKESLLNN